MLTGGGPIPISNTQQVASTSKDRLCAGHSEERRGIPYLVSEFQGLVTRGEKRAWDMMRTVPGEVEEEWDVVEELKVYVGMVLGPVGP